MTAKPSLLFILIGIIPTFLLSAFACDMHGSGGYGFSPFGPRYSMADRNKTERQETRLSITHDRFVSVPNGAPSVLAIAYEVPNSFINVKLRFSSDKDINLLEEPEIVLTKSSGVYKLHFAPQQVGDQHIKVHITALGESSSVEEERHVTVRSI